jgi:hypothetical protein
MFYLLENNKIIDGDNLPVDWKLYQITFDTDTMVVSLWCPDPRERKQFNIVGQSESVLDLIDWDKDLVEVLVPADTIVLQCKFNKLAFVVGEYKYKSIVAIYKKDKNGNFIRAWKGSRRACKN